MTTRYNILSSLLRATKALTLASILLVACTRTYAQQNLADSIRMAIECFETDFERARDLLQIDTARLSQLPDTTRLDYYYYAAAILEWQGKTCMEKVNLLLSAKRILETSIGINQIVYFEIANAIGEEYDNLGHQKEALLVWEDGFIKGLHFLQNEDVGVYLDLIRNHLVDYYEKNNHPEVASWLKSLSIAMPPAACQEGTNGK